MWDDLRIMMYSNKENVILTITYTNFNSIATVFRIKMKRPKNVDCLVCNTSNYVCKRYGAEFPLIDQNMLIR